MDTVSTDSYESYMSPVVKCQRGHEADRKCPQSQKSAFGKLYLCQGDLISVKQCQQSQAIPIQVPGACVSAPLGTLHGTLAWHLIARPGTCEPCSVYAGEAQNIVTVYSVRHGTKRIPFPLPSGRNQTKSLVLGARLGTMYNI